MKYILLLHFLLQQIPQANCWTAGNGKFQWLSPVETGKCSLHGAYVFATRSCLCDPGWGAETDVSLAKSPRCDVRICPAGHSLAESVPSSTTSSHAITECSGAGLCDRATGKCSCFDGFKGRACERFACPNDCNGKGRCLNIAQMAKEDTAFPLTSSTYSYGTYSTIETTTWDQNRTHGCLCDSYSWTVGLDSGEHQLSEYFGPGCTKRRCPSGNDPLTTADETDCNGKSSNGASTTAPTGASGNLCHIECSNRGSCDHKSGLCSCFNGYIGSACQTMSALASTGE
jgi:hypothetical protein